jgi:hypothetical protein
VPGRVSLHWLPAAAALSASLAVAAGCAREPPPAFNPPAQQAPSPDGGVRAIDSARGLGAPEWGRSGNNTGTWGGQQLPNIPASPRL